jgi:hypothetical protein
VVLPVPRFADQAVTVYEWHAWDGFLVRELFPNAHRLSAYLGQDYTDVLAKIRPGIRRFLFHIGLTESSLVPGLRHLLIRRLQSQGIIVLNGRLTDISKRRVQSVCTKCRLPSASASPQGDPEELLIIKTNLNYGGEDEQQLSAKDCCYLGVDGRPHPAIPDGSSYEICTRKDLAPGFWRDRRLAIERFIANEQNLFFRAYVFLEAMVVEAAVNSAPIKKMHNGLLRTVFFFQGLQALPVETHVKSLKLHGPPGMLVRAVRRFCRCIGLDFGSVDVVMNDEEHCFIIDVNTTPYWARADMEEVPAFLRSFCARASE